MLYDNGALPVPGQRPGVMPVGGMPNRPYQPTPRPSTAPVGSQPPPLTWGPTPKNQTPYQKWTAAQQKGPPKMQGPGRMPGARQYGPPTDARVPGGMPQPTDWWGNRPGGFQALDRRRLRKPILHRDGVIPQLKPPGMPGMGMMPGMMPGMGQMPGPGWGSNPIDMVLFGGMQQRPGMSYGNNPYMPMVQQ